MDNETISDRDDQIPCPECDGLGLVSPDKNAEPCDCCLGCGWIPLIIPFSDELPFEVNHE